MEQKIITKIISDAEERAEEIIASATRKAQAEAQALEASLEQERAERLSEIEARTKENLRRTEISARLEANRLLLSAKREALDGVFEETLKKLCSLGAEEYTAFIGALVEKYAEEGDELVLSSKCSFAEKIKQLAVVSRLGLKVSLSDAFEGGAVLVGKKCDKNLTFEALIQSAKDVKQAEVAERIFG